MKRKTPIKRQPLASLEDIRDDCVAVVINSGQSFKRVHENGGPTPQTTSKWLHKETMFPQLATVRAMLNACGHELTIAPQGSNRIERINPEGKDQIVMPAKQAPSKSRLRTATRSSSLIKGIKTRKPVGLAKTLGRMTARKEARKSK